MKTDTINVPGEPTSAAPVAAPASIPQIAAVMLQQVPTAEPEAPRSALGETLPVAASQQTHFFGSAPVRTGESYSSSTDYSSDCGLF